MATHTGSGAVGTRHERRGTARGSHPVIVVVGFATVSAVVIGVAGVLLGLVFGGDTGRRAIVASAGIAWGVQVIAFGVARSLRAWNAVGAWAIGTVLRFGALAVFGLVGVRAWSLVPDAALVSLAVFFFLSTLTEPWFLRS